MKVCPTCKSRCFDDMDTCYGCMHHFSDSDYQSRNNNKEEIMNENIPEYFELDSFPFIEDENYFKTRGAHERIKNDNDEKIVIKLELPKSVLEKYIV